MITFSNSFLGVQIFNNALWIQNDKYKPRPHKYEDVWFIVNDLIILDPIKYTEEFLLECRYPGPFKSEDEAHAWLTWAKVILA